MNYDISVNLVHSEFNIQFEHVKVPINSPMNNPLPQTFLSSIPEGFTSYNRKQKKRQVRNPS